MKQISSSDLPRLWRETATDVMKRFQTLDSVTGMMKPLELASEWEVPFYSGERKVLVMGGEGAGKSFTAGLFGVCHSVFDALFGAELYWVVGADFEDARTDFDAVVKFQEQLGNIKELSASTNADQQCRLVTKTGQLWTTVSGYDPTKIGRDEPDGIIGAEVSRWYQELFERCEGRLIRKPYSWGFFSGSFEESRGWLPDLYRYAMGPNPRGIRAYTVPSWANRFKFPLGRQDPAILEAEASRSPQKFMERFGGQPAPGRGIIFGEFNVGLHVDRSLEYDSELPVYLAIDPGTRVYAVEFVQLRLDGEVWVVDEIYESRWTHEQVIMAARMKAGWPLVRGGTMDIAGKQGHGAMSAPLDAWRRDTGLSLFAQHCALEDTIERVRWTLSSSPKTGRPRLRVHPRCKGLIAEMGGGTSPLEDGGPWMYSESRSGLGPPRPENDHASKALGYLLMGPFGYKLLERKSSSGGDGGPLTYLTPRGRKRRQFTYA